MLIHLVGGIRIVDGAGSVGEDRLPGRLGRLAFAYLAAEHRRPVPRDEIAHALWGDDPPATWEKGVSVLISKLRAVFVEAGLDRNLSLSNAFGCYQLRLPPGASVDLVEVAPTLRDAEGALTAGHLGQAVDLAERVTSLTDGQFLAGEDKPWVRRLREELLSTRLRALDCLSAAHLAAGRHREAVATAESAVALDPFRESAYVQLMRAHAAAGNRAEALRVHERCRQVLADELGVDPSPETRSAHLLILKASGPQAPPPDAAAVARPSAPPQPSSAPTSPPPVVGGGVDRRLLPTGLRANPGVRTRRRAALIAAAVVAVAAGVTVTAATGIARHQGEANIALVPGPDTVARLTGGALGFDTVSPTRGRRATGVAVGGGSVWVVSYESQTLARLDERTGRPLDVRAVGGTPTGIAYGAGFVWVTAGLGYGGGAGAVVRFDGSTGAPDGVLPLGDGVRGIAFGDGGVWVTNELTGTVSRIDPVSGNTTRTVEVGRQPLAVAVGSGSIWVTDALGGSVVRLDAATESVEAVIDVPSPSAVTAGSGGVWVLSTARSTVTRIDPATNDVVTTIGLPAPPLEAAVLNGDLWISMGEGSLVRLDASTDHITATAPVRGSADALAASDGALWLTVHDP